ncbi:hypothetical protein AB0C34_28590 [Nocardia sp. NPDC049220]
MTDLLDEMDNRAGRGSELPLGHGEYPDEKVWMRPPIVLWS